MYLKFVKHVTYDATRSHVTNLSHDYIIFGSTTTMAKTIKHGRAVSYPPNTLHKLLIM